MKQKSPREYSRGLYVSSPKYVLDTTKGIDTPTIGIVVRIFLFMGKKWRAFCEFEANFPLLSATPKSEEGGRNSGTKLLKHLQSPLTLLQPRIKMSPRTREYFRVIVFISLFRRYEMGGLLYTLPKGGLGEVFYFLFFFLFKKQPITFRKRWVEKTKTLKPQKFNLFVPNNPLKYNTFFHYFSLPY